MRVSISNLFFVKFIFGQIYFSDDESIAREQANSFLQPKKLEKLEEVKEELIKGRAVEIIRDFTRVCRCVKSF